MTMFYATLQQTVTDGLSAVFQTPTNAPGWRGFVQSWFSFSDWRLMVRLAVGIAVAVALASVVAFHPRTYGRARSAAELDHPTALLIYAVIGAVVAQIVAVEPAMALVVFGIGGLLRFRTDIGEADDTGQVILVTIVGVACGLTLFPLAVLATGTGWLLLYHLKSKRPFEFAVLPEDPEQLEHVEGRMQAAINSAGLTLVRTNVQARKGRVKVLARGPAESSFSDIERAVRSASHPSEVAFEWDE